MVGHDADVHIQVTVTWQVASCQTCDVAMSSSCVPCSRTPSQDLSVISNTVTFADGIDSVDVTIDITEDTVSEFETVYLIVLSGVTGGGVLDVTGNAMQLTVKESDFPYGIVFLQPVDVGGKRDITVNEGDTLVFNMNRYLTTYGTIVINYVILLGNASAGDITTPLYGNVTMPNGVTQVNFSVEIANDNVPELDETLTVSLPVIQQGHATIDPLRLLAEVHVLIVRNDFPYGLLAFAAAFRQNDSTVDEGDTIDIMIDRNRGHFGNVSVFWQVSGINTSSQIAPTSGIVVFRENEDVGMFTLSPVDDGDLPEPARAYTITLTHATGGAAIDPFGSAGIITLTSSDDYHGDFAIFRAPATGEAGSGEAFQEPGEAGGEGLLDTGLYPEPMSGTSSIRFTIRRRGGKRGEVTVYYRAVSGAPFGNMSATAGEDFVVLNTSIVFADGESEHDVFVYLKADAIPELDETATVEITHVAVSPADFAGPFANNVVSPRVSPTAGEAAFTIAANDFPMGIFDVATTVQVSVEEGDMATVIITRNAGSFYTVQVDWMVMFDGTAEVADVLQVAGTVTFAVNETEKGFTIGTFDDSIPELAERFSVHIKTNAALFPMTAVGEQVRHICGSNGSNDSDCSGRYYGSEGGGVSRVGWLTL